MKLVKVKIKIEPIAGGGTHYTYPPEYWDCILQPITYESENDYASVKERKKQGIFEEYILCICPLDHELNHPDFEEIDEATADELLKRWKKPKEDGTAHNIDEFF